MKDKLNVALNRSHIDNIEFGVRVTFPSVITIPVQIEDRHAVIYIGVGMFTSRPATESDLLMIAQAIALKE
jgi:hypothetical protein